MLLKRPRTSTGPPVQRNQTSSQICLGLVFNIAMPPREQPEPELKKHQITVIPSVLYARRYGLKHWCIGIGKDGKDGYKYYDGRPVKKM